MRYLVDLLTKEHPYPSALFKVVYRLTGLYLFSFTLWFIPVGTLLYSTEGYLPLYTLNNLPAWMSIFSISSTPTFVLLMLCTLATLGGIMALGKISAIYPLSAWVLYLSFYNRNIFTMNPGTDVIGYLLIVLAIIALITRVHGLQNSTIPLPSILYHGTWLMLGLTFTASGIERLRADAWISGTGFSAFLQVIPLQNNPISRTLHAFIASLPSLWLTAVTWLILITFIMALPLSVWQRGKPYILSLLTLIFLTLLVIANLSQVTLALLLLFLFLSDVYFSHGDPETNLARRCFVYIRDNCRRNLTLLRP